MQFIKTLLVLSATVSALDFPALGGAGGLVATNPIINSAGHAEILQPGAPGSLLTAQSVINILGPPGCAASGYALGIHKTFNVSNIINTCLCIEVKNPAAGKYLCPACPENSSAECQSNGDPCGCKCDTGFYSDASGACIEEPSCVYPMVAAPGTGNPICICAIGFIQTQSQLGPACVLIGQLPSTTIVPTSSTAVSTPVSSSTDLVDASSVALVASSATISTVPTSTSTTPAPASTTPVSTSVPTPTSTEATIETVTETSTITVTETSSLSIPSILPTSSAPAAPCASLGRRSRSRRAAGINGIVVNNGTFVGGFACAYGNAGPLAAEGSGFVELSPTATAVVIPHLKLCGLSQTACFNADGSAYCVDGSACP